MRKHISQLQCQSEDVPYSTSHRNISRIKLKLITIHLRSTMVQDRLRNLVRLIIESDIANKIDVDTVIRSFANKKARKAILFY